MTHGYQKTSKLICPDKLRLSANDAAKHQHLAPHPVCRVTHKCRKIYTNTLFPLKFSQTAYTEEVVLFFTVSHHVEAKQAFLQPSME